MLTLEGLIAVLSFGLDSCLRCGELLVSSLSFSLVSCVKYDIV